MWMRWMKFFCKSLAWIYVDYLGTVCILCAKQPGGGAHDSDAAGRRRLGVSHSSTSATSPTTGKRERANGVRPCHGHAGRHYIHVNITRCACGGVSLQIAVP